MSQKRKHQRNTKRPGSDILMSTPAITKSQGSVPLLFAAAVLSGILSNATFGVINNSDPGCSHLVTLLQQIFTLAFTWRKGEHIWKRPLAKSGKGHVKSGMQVPLKWHLAVVLCLTGGCFLGNLALDLKLPLPLFFLIKCGNLVASMVVGALFLKRSYSYDQVFSVVWVTVGLIHSTMHSHSGSFNTLDYASISIFIGAFSVFLALVSTSFLGALQEIIFARYREHFDEVTFVSTLLFIPFYITLNYSSIYLHLIHWIHGGWSHVLIPLVVNAISNHICRLTMSQLTGASSQGALTSMYAATTYRFSAIIVSSWASQAGQESNGMWVGVVLVFIGTLISFTSEGVTKTSSKVDSPAHPTSNIQFSPLRKRKQQTASSDSMQASSVMHPRTQGTCSAITSIDTERGRDHQVAIQGPKVRGGASSSHSPTKSMSKLRRRASAPKLSQWEIDHHKGRQRSKSGHYGGGIDFELEELDRALREVTQPLSPASSLMRRSSSLHTDLDLLQSMRYSSL